MIRTNILFFLFTLNRNKQSESPQLPSHYLSLSLNSVCSIVCYNYVLFVSLYCFFPNIKVMYLICYIIFFSTFIIICFGFFPFQQNSNSKLCSCFIYVCVSPWLYTVFLCSSLSYGSCLGTWISKKEVTLNNIFDTLLQKMSLKGTHEN